MKVLIIKSHPNTVFKGDQGAVVGVAENLKTAKKWVKDEIAGLHQEDVPVWKRRTYSKDKKAKWFLEEGYFTFDEVDWFPAPKPDHDALLRMIDRKIVEGVATPADIRKWFSNHEGGGDGSNV